MADRNDFSNRIPGLDFLQGLARQASGNVPGLNQWVAPTLDPEEIGQRIEQLRTVQAWLEQNAQLVAATIQALEVQRMTLATLKTMNFSLGEVAQSWKMNSPPAAAARADKPAAATAGASGAAPKPSGRTRASRPKSPPQAASPAPAQSAAGADAMQWWNALTQQFGQIAAQALQDGAASTAAAASPPAPSADAPARSPRAAGARRKPA